MQEEVRTVLVETLAIAEPLVAVFGQALGNALGGVNAAVGAVLLGQSLEVVGFHLLLLIQHR